MNSTFHFRPELLHAVDSLRLSSRTKLSSSYIGTNESPHRGSGMQFKEFRQYEFGDDVRHISWTTTAKAGKPMLKLYEEEREINVLLLLDTSGSSLFGSKRQRKIDMYSEVLALLGLASLQSGFRFGSLFFDSEVRHFARPSRKKEELIASLNELLSLDLHKRTSDLRPALQYCFRALSHRTLIVVLSDFLLPPFREDLKVLALKHEITLLQGFDDSERMLSNRGVTEICDPETSDFYLLDFESPACRQAISKFYAGFTEQLEQISRECHADFLPVSVQDDYLQRLVYFFNKR